MTLKLKCILILVFLIFSLIGRGEELSIDQILELARGQNIEQTIIENNYLVNFYQSKQVYANTLPKLDFQLSSAYGRTQNQNLPGAYKHGSQHSWNLTWVGPSSNLRDFSSAYKAYHLSLNIAEKNRQFEQDRFYMDIVRKFGSSLKALSTFKVAEKTESYAITLKNYTDLEHKNGGVSQLDKLQADSFFSHSRATVLLAKQDYKGQLARLKNSLGIPKENSLFISDKLEEKGKYFEVPSINEEKNSHSLELAKLQVEYQEQVADVRRNSLFPSLSLFALAANNGRDQWDDLWHEQHITYQGGLQFNWTLFDGLKNTSQWYEAAAQKVIAEATLHKQEMERNLALQEAINNVKILKEILQANKQSEQAAKLLFEQLDDDFRSGRAELSAVLDSERRWSLDVKELYETYTKLIFAIASLKELLGHPIY